MKKRIILVTGGRRSGKSEFAEKTALEMSARPVYLATARVFDNEMADRVRVHKERRGDAWDTVEESLHLSLHKHPGRTILVDCVTLWATEAFFSHGEDTYRALAFLRDEFDAFTAAESEYIFVTNEVGLGGVSENAMQRRFDDLQGLINQYIASKADEVFFLVAGVPVKIK